MKRCCLALSLFALLAVHAVGQEPAPLKVHMLGSGEYSPVESLTGFKKYLEERYRVQCTTSFSKDSKSLPNLEALKSADVLVVFLRRMNLPEEQMALIRAHWEAGKPVVALRTASHAFQPADNEVFDRQVLGGDYKGAGSYSTPFKAIPVKEQAGHAVVQGVGPITSKGYYNNGKLAEDAIVLQVVESERKTPQPVTWAHTYKGGRTIYSSMGVPEDFQDDNFRRLLTQAIFWTAQREPNVLKLAK
ncbi:MAG: ThuA domain-containing protein [Planctomycetia bacterium]|nr:ThuA domain-containing protein [Planctomycetia bacterium]